MYDLNQILGKLRQLDEASEMLENKKKILRKQLHDIMTENEMPEYKNEYATVSVAVKSKYIYDDEYVLKKYPRFQKTVVSPWFERNIKAGTIKDENVQIEKTTYPVIRFKREINPDNKKV